MDEIINIVKNAPAGISAGGIEAVAKVSRATINRKLRDAVNAGEIVKEGKGQSIIYRDADPLRAIKSYFEKPHTERPIAPYREDLLSASPEFDISSLAPISSFRPLEKRDMVKFLVDFACASSILEGGTYSLLDTQALIEYGEKAPGKPLPDAFLVLNHKNAFEFLYDNRHLNIETIVEVHKRLVSNHNIDELRSAPHFLEEDRCGLVREYEEVNIAQSTYLPPVRPGTKYILRMLEKIVRTSGEINDPVQSAFYILTRLPYLQPFNDGNKRTSRVMCNVPLLNAGLPPISFVDFSKRDYIVSLLAFYELGDVRMASRCFCDAYMKSCNRLGLIDIRPEK